MPELTPRLGIKKPLGHETVTRKSFNENWDIVDENVATKEQFNQFKNTTETEISNLKLFVDNGKSGLRSAIIGKQGTITGAHPNSFEQLIEGVQSIQTGVNVITAGDTTTLAVNNENRYGTTTSYVKHKEFKINGSGSVRVFFNLRPTDSNVLVYGKIYVNGVARGIERTANDTNTWLNFVEDITVETGDLIQLYLRTQMIYADAHNMQFRLNVNLGLVTIMPV